MFDVEIGYKMYPKPQIQAKDSAKSFDSFFKVFKVLFQDLRASFPWQKRSMDNNPHITWMCRAANSSLTDVSVIV